MHLSHALLLVAVIFLAHCHIAFGNSGLSKLKDASPTHRDQDGAVSAEIQSLRHLRGYNKADNGDITATEDEDRAFDFKKLLDYKKLLGLKSVPTEFANGVITAFSKATVKEMLKNRKFREIIFKEWDNVQLDTLVQLIGSKTLANKRVAKMFVDYRYNHRVYKWPVSR